MNNLFFIIGRLNNYTIENNTIKLMVYYRGDDGDFTIPVYMNFLPKNNVIELLEEEAALSSQVIKLQDPEYRARYARENQMYTKDGETILIIIDKDKKKIIDEDQ